MKQNQASSTKMNRKSKSIIKESSTSPTVTHLINEANSQQGTISKKPK